MNQFWTYNQLYFCVDVSYQYSLYSVVKNTYMIIVIIKKLTLCTRTNSQLLRVYTKRTNEVMDEKALRLLYMAPEAIACGFCGADINITLHCARIVLYCIVLYFTEQCNKICFQKRAGRISFLAT